MLFCIIAILLLIIIWLISLSQAERLGSFIVNKIFKPIKNIFSEGENKDDK